jgi:2-methylaconitate cis-trans-isomerase PrpF
MLAMDEVSRIVAAGDPEQTAIRCLFMRGGSSRGGVFLADELPEDPIDRAATLLACYGSPDHRQIDGIGGSDPLTSKAAVVARSKRADADLDYTFYQIGIDRAQVSTGGNCGNMLAAVGPFGILRGLIRPSEPETAIRIFTTNTGQVVTARIQVGDGFPRVNGDARVAGVPGTGSSIAIDFGDCAGSVSGKLLPTGRARDRIRAGGHEVEVSFIDAATPFVFVPAAAFGASGIESPAEIAANAPLMTALEEVRGWAAQILGLVDDPAKAQAVTPNMPRVIMIAPPADYVGSEGAVSAGEIDLCVRQLAMQKPHNTLAVTGAVCTAVAAKVPDSVVQELARDNPNRTRLGHPAGMLSVTAKVVSDGSGLKVLSAAIERTARLIMAGDLFVARHQVEYLKSVLRNVAG